MKRPVPIGLRYLAIVLVGIAGIATASMKAIIVGTYVSEFGLRAGEAGYVLSAAMVAATTGTIVSAFLPSRRMLAAALASIFAGDFATATLASSSTLILCQVIAGMGHGFALGRMAKAIAAVENSARATGLYTLGYLILSSACIYFLPNLQQSLGSHALFILLALTGPLGMVGLMWLPSRAAPRERHQSEPANSGAARSPGVLNLRTAVLTGAGLFVYYVSIGGYWPFMSRFADAWQIDSTTRLHILGVAQMMGLAGASISIVFGNRVGTVRPLTALLLLQSGAIALLAFGPPLVRVYAVSACLYVFAWLGGFPYLLGLLSKLDSGGRLNALMMVVANAAYAIGPASAGYLINAAANEAAGLTYVRSLGLALQVCGSMLILLLAVTHRHSLPVGGGLHPARGQSS